MIEKIPSVPWFNFLIRIWGDSKCLCRVLPLGILYYLTLRSSKLGCRISGFFKQNWWIQFKVKKDFSEWKKRGMCFRLSNKRAARLFVFETFFLPTQSYVAYIFPYPYEIFILKCLFWHNIKYIILKMHLKLDLRIGEYGFRPADLLNFQKFSNHHSYSMQHV